MDPNVQVAFVSVLVAIVTTSGVVVTALINRPSGGGHARTEEEEDHLDESDVLERMLSLIRENERKEESIGRLRHRVDFLEAENRGLKAENAQLILQARDRNP